MKKHFNKRGATAFIILAAVIYFMAGMILYQFLKPVIDEQRNPDKMNCEAATDYGDKAECLLIDAIIPLVVIGILSATGGIVTDTVLSK